MMSPVHRVCVHTPVMLSVWSKAVGRVRRYSMSHTAAGWGRSSPGSIYPDIRGVNLQAENPTAATEACPFLAVPAERENMGAVRDHRRQAHVNLESSVLPKKAQLQHNPSMPGFSDPPRPSLQTKAGWKKTVLERFCMYPTSSPHLHACPQLPASPTRMPPSRGRNLPGLALNPEQQPPRKALSCPWAG